MSEEKKCPKCKTPMVMNTPHVPLKHKVDGLCCQQIQLATKDTRIEKYEEYADRMNPVLDELSNLGLVEESGADDDLIRAAITEIENLRATMLNAANAIREACQKHDDTLSDDVITWPLYAELEQRLRRAAKEKPTENKQ